MCCLCSMALLVIFRRFFKGLHFFLYYWPRSYSTNQKNNLLSDEKWYSCQGNSQWFADRVTAIKNVRSFPLFTDKGTCLCSVALLSRCWSALSYIHRHDSQSRHKIYELWNILYIDISIFFNTHKSLLLSLLKFRAVSFSSSDT